MRPFSSYLELRSLPTAVPCARLHAKQVVWEWGLKSLTEVIELLVSELMTNAVQIMAGQAEPGTIRFRLSSDRVRVLIEIGDPDPRPPQCKPVVAGDVPALDAEGGRGLFLVATLSRRWGWYLVQPWGGKVMWAEVGDMPCR